MDTQTTYLGLKLKNPLIVSACKLSENIENIKKMEAAGAAAVVTYSIFEEEINYDSDFIDYFKDYGTEQYQEALTYFPDFKQQGGVLKQHLQYLTQACKAVEIPIIGSLNAVSQENWIEYAQKMQDTGISALELNLYKLITNPKLSATQIEEQYLTTVQVVKDSIDIPVAVKLHPFFTSLPRMIQQLADKGTDGVILFNRFYYPDFDINKLEFKENLGLSDSSDIYLPLRWIAILYGQTCASIAANTGANSSSDVIKYLLAGADVVMFASAIIKHGIEYISKLLQELEDWLTENKYSSISEIKGMVTIPYNSTD